MPTWNYSLMMMGCEYMVDGDDVGDDGGEYIVETALSGVESRTNLALEMKILMVVALCFVKSFVLLRE
jgi:hypothetical protein